ncbi:choline ABC transporter substrate-binding protein [Marinivivus vitaminiproducens]|uniref:choline ABC transporter substrate-binding protein n=1 Tax=Marinivivus vitaminiproducens TaxID=3035935 RepID=UPI0027AB3BF6|nr:choline ABC transporter substrate-binding protein [Geminicoccaceae bacterium SCSIO 64248]
MTARSSTPAAVLAAAALLTAPGLARAADDASCATVRMPDPGWTDIASTNAFAGLVLAPLGYEQRVETVAVPVAFQGLKTGELDVFLGNWMPMQADTVDPMTESGDLAVIHNNLEGVKFTLAVPNYVAEQGVTDFSDLAEHADQFGQQIYGIEAGSSVNQKMKDMIASGDFGLTEWQLVESSEQAMLAQVERAVRGEDWVVFLAWEPHPMNTKLGMTYLTGGDEWFGPNLGSATIRTVSRKGFAEACPNLGKLFDQMTFTVDMENTVMAAVADGSGDFSEAAEAYVKEHPGMLDAWLEGVTTLEGEPGLPAVKTGLGLE